VLDWLPVDPWLSCTAPLTSGTAARSPGLLDTLIGQFQVATHPRYQPRDVGSGRTTFCNVFLSDATKALGCGIPHVDLTAAGWGELDANACIRWLASVGQRHGWQPLLRGGVLGAADAGRVVVATYLAPGAIGHVALVVPSYGTHDILITQAGARCFEREPLEHGFGGLPVAFFFHQ
jgi:hypothetical protein